MKIKSSECRIWLMVFFFGWSACTPDPSCNDIYIPAVLASFYELDGEGNLVRDTIFFDSVYAENARADSSLVNKNDTTLLYPLFVDPENNSTTFHFCLNDACNQITFTYDRREFLLSEECGPRFRYQNLTAEHNFDSISVLKTELNIVDDINVQIFR